MKRMAFAITQCMNIEDDSCVTTVIQETNYENEYTKIASALRNIVPMSKVNIDRDHVSHYSLNFRFPKSFGLSRPEVLETIETEVRNKFNFGFHKNFNFTFSTYTSTWGLDNKHLDMTIHTNEKAKGFEKNGWDLNRPTHKKIVDSIIDFISTINK